MSDSARFTKPAPGQPPGLELGGWRHGRFELVLHGSRLCLEGWCEEPGQEPWQCSAWLEPFDAPKEVAHRLLERPSCCLTQRA